VRRWLLSVVLALSVVSTGQAARLPSACGLLTNAEVVTALGAKIETRSIRGYDGLFRSCSWTSVPLGSFTSAQSQLTVQIAATTKAKFEKQAKLFPGAFPIRGIGEIAFATPPGNVQSLYVWERGFALTVSATAVSSPLGVEKTLTKVMLTRL
jgi:hypothetical protein